MFGLKGIKTVDGATLNAKTTAAYLITVVAHANNAQ